MFSFFLFSLSLSLSPSLSLSLFFFSLSLSLYDSWSLFVSLLFLLKTSLQHFLAYLDPRLSVSLSLYFSPLAPIHYLTTGIS